MKISMYLFGILMIVLIFNGCSSQKQATLEDSGAVVIAEQIGLIRENIPDPERQTALLRIVTEVEKLSAEFFGFYKTYRQEIVRLNKNFAAGTQGTSDSGTRCPCKNG